MSGKETVRNLLKSILNEINYNDSKVEIKPVSSGGANYTSELYVITVTHEHKDTLHLFAKIATINDSIRENLNSVYEAENYVYRKLVTAYNEIQEKHRIPKDEQFHFPKFYGSSLEVGNETFVFENLFLKGYQTYDRFKTMDNLCLFAIITMLAKFHALGLALEKERPELYKLFRTEQFYDNFSSFFEPAQDKVHSYINTLDEQYREKLQKFVKNKGIDVYKKTFSRRGKFLIHGDYRGSNIMFKKEGDKIIVVPVDYQCVRAGCALTDLLYFITISTDENFRVNHFEELIGHYYKQLSLYSSKLGVDINDVYSEMVFQEELKELLPSMLLLALNIYPIIMVDSDQAPVVSDDNMGMSDFFVKPNHKATEKLAGFVRDCERWGII